MPHGITRPQWVKDLSMSRLMGVTDRVCMQKSDSHHLVVSVSVSEKLSWFIRHLSDVFYILFKFVQSLGRYLGPAGHCKCPMFFVNNRPIINYKYDWKKYPQILKNARSNTGIEVACFMPEAVNNSIRPVSWSETSNFLSWTVNFYPFLYKSMSNFL